MIKYFLASLAIPDEDQWVNLSPYEKDRIIKEDFGKTEMGRDLLAEDYILKQITASLIYPEENLGKKFWDKIYSQAYREFGTSNISVNTFNKVWIVPDSAEVYEKGNAVFLIRSHLKVMMEEDYLSLQKHTAIPSIPNSVQMSQANKAHRIASKIVKEIIIPELETEVNEGKNFAALRQAYSGMILAAWYKRALKESVLGQVYANKSKVKGVDQDPKNNLEIYHRYLRAYKKGVFNFIKEDVDKYTNETIPRKYFSGGIAPLKWKIVHKDTNAEGNQAAQLMLDDPETELVSSRVGAFNRQAAMKTVDEMLAGIPEGRPITLDHISPYTVREEMRKMVSSKLQELRASTIGVAYPFVSQRAKLEILKGIIERIVVPRIDNPTFRQQFDAFRGALLNNRDHDILEPPVYYRSAKYEFKDRESIGQKYALNAHSGKIEAVPEDPRLIFVMMQHGKDYFYRDFVFSEIDREAIKRKEDQIRESLPFLLKRGEFVSGKAVANWLTYDAGLSYSNDTILVYPLGAKNPAVQ